MQVDSDIEIINLDPNVIYETEDESEDEVYEDDFHMSENQEAAAVSTADFEYKNKKNGIVKEENKQMVDDDGEDKEPCVQSKEIVNMIALNQKPRRKLNLAEYKIIRANRPAPPILVDECENVVLELCKNVPDTLPPIELPTDPRSIKALLDKPHQHASVKCTDEVEKSVSDNKTAVEEKEINEKIHEKEESNASALHSDYEEVVLVSINCNTEISIPPLENDEEYESKTPAKFLTNIVNTIQKDNNAKTLLNSSTTLLSSINAVLYEKCNSTSSEVKTTAISENKEQNNVLEQGENKVIKHLRKDRVQPMQESSAVQTDTSPLFPPLILSPALIFNRIKNARHFRRKSRSRSRSRSKSRSRSISPENDYYKRSVYKYPRSLHSSTVNSSEFDSSSESDSSAYSSCRSSDFDSVRKFDNQFHSGYRKKRPNFTYEEERRIVYVGGLAEDTSKDELRRKFLKYGTIKKISTHVKEDINGLLRFGFITFAEASSAYDVLDKFKLDPTLCIFDIRFGGRRKFCKQTYADLDSLPNENDIDMYNIYNNNSSSGTANTKHKTVGELSFEDLLNITKRKLCKQK